MISFRSVFQTQQQFGEVLTPDAGFSFGGREEPASSAPSEVRQPTSWGPLTRPRAAVFHFHGPASRWSRAAGENDAPEVVVATCKRAEEGNEGEESPLQPAAASLWELLLMAGGAR